MRLPSTLSTVPTCTPSAPMTSICSAMFCMVGSLLRTHITHEVRVRCFAGMTMPCAASDQRLFRRGMMIEDLPIAVLAHDDPAHFDDEVRPLAGEIERRRTRCSNAATTARAQS